MTIKPHDFLPISTKVLVVDDEPDNRQVRSRLLKKFCAEVIEAGTEPAAWKCIAECVASDEPIIVLLDLQLATGDTSQSLEFIKKVSAKRWIADGYCGVMVMSAYATAQEKLDLFANSALGMVWDKIEMSPTDLNLLLAICERDLSTRRTQRLAASMPEQVLGNSLSLRQTYTTAAKIAKLETPDEIPVVFIQGESGTGKDALAQYIHNESKRQKYRFERLNCGGFRANPQLFEAAIFGQIAGIVGGAARRVGSLEHAGQGTLFLDDLQELPWEAQSVLLQALTTKTYQVMGDPTTKPWQAALIVAYNKDPRAAMENGELQPQLYFRLVKHHKLALPNLCDRGDDVLLVAAHIVSRFWDLYYPGRSIIGGCFSAEVRSHLLSLKYRQGNFRELEEIVRDACRRADAAGRTNLLLEDFLVADTKPSEICLREAYEVMAIQEADRTTRTRDEAAAKFGIGRAQYFKLRKAYQLKGLLPKDDA